MNLRSWMVSYELVKQRRRYLKIYIFPSERIPSSTIHMCELKWFYENFKICTAYQVKNIGEKTAHDA